MLRAASYGEYSAILECILVCLCTLGWLGFALPNLGALGAKRKLRHVAASV